jgi:EAL domain-containing protein (putative c-di-GMP-specific phosphodiesterase class I)
MMALPYVAPFSPPIEIFKLAKDPTEVTYLDRLCRALHITSFKQGADDMNWLFLNVNPNVVVNGRRHSGFFRELLDILDFRPEQIVIEILESALLDESQLCSSADFYRELGCLIAIDDFGAGHSNFQRIWRVRPHIVKLDQTIIRHANSNRLAKRMLPNIVATLHEAGSLVLMEGIESEDEAMIAMETNIDLVQGYYFSRPAFKLVPNVEVKPVVEKLFNDYRYNLKNTNAAACYKQYIIGMQQAALALISNSELETELDLVKQYLNLPGADRYYLLSEDGIQIGQSRIISNFDRPTCNHFRPLDQACAASWIRRPYLQRALQKPEEVHRTRPYLSVATGHLCVTLSVAYLKNELTQVLCYDLDHETIENHFSPKVTNKLEPILQRISHG